MTEGYHDIIAAYPRVRLATLPTPLERAERVEHALRRDRVASVPRLHLKRDDLLSLGLGGNKVRNLEFLLGQAVAEGATDVVTAGRQQSNHCRLTAAACARTGLNCHLVMSGTAPVHRRANLLLDDIFGATTHFVGSDAREERAALVEEVARGVRAAGRRPFVIAVGGSEVRGAVGHVLLAEELVAQLPAVSAIVLATATGGTQSGLLCGLRAMGHAAQVHGFAVAKSAEELRDDVSRLGTALADELHLARPDLSKIDIDGAMLGGGYGVATTEGAAAIDLLARTEGVIADPVYTGKGLAGLWALVRAGRFGVEDDVVFLHTGGAPAVFA